MKVYHGTGAFNLPSILMHGLKPRGARAAGNWAHTIKSHSQMVYLTDCYAVYYATAARMKDDKLLVIELELDELDPMQLYPDEDFLEQATHFGQQHMKGSRKARTKWFVRHIKDFKDDWRISLEHLGTIGHCGIIKPQLIKRYALIDPLCPVFWASDPTISLINHQLKGRYYHCLMQKVFGDEMSASDLEAMVIPGDQEYLTKLPRDGIEVYERDCGLDCTLRRVS